MAGSQPRCVDSRKRKRSEERGEMANLATMSACMSSTDFDSIPLATAVLTSRLRKEIHDVWDQHWHRTEDPFAESSRPSTSLDEGDWRTVPTFKVGTSEMYRRFPDAYDSFMKRHSCGALQEHLLNDVVGRIVASRGQQEVEASQSDAFLHVADFGCGTGRIGAILAQHTSTSTIYGYDSEQSMLERCLVNIVRSAAAAGHYNGVVLLPQASVTPPKTVISLTDTSASAFTDTKHLSLCVRPCPFQCIQAGFLSASGHRPCHLAVCAWSLSYVMRLQWGGDRWYTAVDTVIQQLYDLLDNSTCDAAVVVIETLGNGTEEPSRKNTLTQRLEETLGFTKHWVRTDYNFSCVEEAIRLTRFFFGERMAKKVEVQQTTCLMECTGIWTKWKLKHS